MSGWCSRSGPASPANVILGEPTPHLLRHTATMPPVNLKTIARRGLIAAAFNTVLAAAITLTGFHGFWANVVYSQFIGLTIWALIDGGRQMLASNGYPGAPAMAALVVGSVLVGYFGGSALGDLVLGEMLLHGMSRSPRTMVGFFLMSLAAGGFGTFYLTSREQLAKARLAHEEAQRHAAEARLKLLETQLEPHMLFNTLANLRALIGTDPARATDMLDRMVAYLRATLGASRATAHPLQAEFDRLRDYLELMAVRMGPRLRYTLDLPHELADCPVPPLLLQPLVENAIKHGLEPKVEGGSITVSAQRDDARMLLTVLDTGVGLRQDHHLANGFGVAQVRERLATIYGNAGAIELIAAPGEGTRATVTFPCENAQKQMVRPS